MEDEYEKWENGWKEVNTLVLFWLVHLILSCSGETQVSWIICFCLNDLMW